jgi:predicted transcriptional regulator
MKSLSLKLDDAVFEETEEITAKLKLARNRYINEALEVYNRLNKRRLLKNQLAKESAIGAEDSMEVLRELEMLLDGAD